MNYRERIRMYVGVAGDLLVFNAGLWLALAVRRMAIPDLGFIEQHLFAFNLLFTLWIVGGYAMGLYDIRRFRDLPWVIRNVLFAGLVNLGVGLIFFYFFYPYSIIGMTPKTHFILALVFGHAGLFVIRRIALMFFDRLAFRQTVAFLGPETSVAELKVELNRHPQVGFRPVKWSAPSLDLAVINGRWLDEHWDEAQPVIRRIVAGRIPVASFSEFYESMMGKIPLEAAARPNWLLSAVLSRNARWYRQAKRAVDLVLGVAIAVVFAPVIAACAAAILVFDGRPVFFGQKRIGRLGSEFVMWKFRTLAVGSEKSGPFTGSAATARQATVAGRWLRRCRLDELPQLWNVLIGDMSLVGPRPEWTREIEVLEKAIPLYHLRHLVRPGMTGWAQLNFRATRSPSDSIEKFRYDLYYVKHLSLDLDLTILLRTVRRLVVRDAEMKVAGRQAFRVPGRFEKYAADFQTMLGWRARA